MNWIEISKFLQCKLPKEEDITAITYMLALLEATCYLDGTEGSHLIVQSGADDQNVLIYWHHHRKISNEPAVDYFKRSIA